MALKGADISATYQDWVHVNKSGAGLPDHAGAEAALYLDDGAGGVDQILGRTAVRHWLDPDPDAIAGTWEFSTYGDASQATLEAAGWTFSNCTGSVTGGMLRLVSTGSNNARATITVSLDGDFDYVTKIFSDPLTASGAWDVAKNMKIGIPGDVGHLVGFQTSSSSASHGVTVSTTYDAEPASGTSANIDRADWSDIIGRICRFSGTVYCVFGGYFSIISLGTAAGTGNAYGLAGASGVEGSTYTRICFAFDATTSGQAVLIPFLRRYA